MRNAVLEILISRSYTFGEMNFTETNFTRMFNLRVITIYFLFCSGLNFQDLIVRLGAIASPPKTPCILGFECAGEVEAVGEGVTTFAVSFFKKHQNLHEKNFSTNYLNIFFL